MQRLPQTFFFFLPRPPENSVTYWHSIWESIFHFDFTVENDFSGHKTIK